MKLPAHIALTGRKRPVSGSDRTPVYAVVGNPNCGKTTLFNALTGLRQKVGNYPGVTVEKKIGITYSQHGRPIQLIEAERTPALAAYLDSLSGVVNYVSQTFSLFQAAEELRPPRLLTPKRRGEAGGLDAAGR